MPLLMLTLKDESLIRKVIPVFVELELLDTTVLDGEGVENLAVRTVPLFEEIGGLFGKNLAYNRTILSPVPDRRTVDELVRLCQRDGVNLMDPSVATLLLLPCERYTPNEQRASEKT